MSMFKGLLYVKHGQVGSKMEGPVYFLQTVNKDYVAKDFVVHYSDRPDLWNPDYYLEFFCRTMVEIDGNLTAPDIIKASSISIICERNIPQS